MPAALELWNHKRFLVCCPLPAGSLDQGGRGSAWPFKHWHARGSTKHKCFPNKAGPENFAWTQPSWSKGFLLFLMIKDQTKMTDHDSQKGNLSKGSIQKGLCMSSIRTPHPTLVNPVLFRGLLASPSLRSFDPHVQGDEIRDCNS